MNQHESLRSERRAKLRDATKAGIMSAARIVAERQGAAGLSLRSVAAEAGFAPAALYVYFSCKTELIIALATEDLGNIAREMRKLANTNDENKSCVAASAALALLSKTETLAAAATALNSQAKSRPARLFSGRLIAALSALSEATGGLAKDRQAQADVLLIAATLTGLAMLTRSGQLEVLGFGSDELLARLPRFGRSAQA